MVIGYWVFYSRRINSVPSTTIHTAYKMIVENADYDLCEASRRQLFLNLQSIKKDSSLKFKYGQQLKKMSMRMGLPKDVDTVDIFGDNTVPNMEPPEIIDTQITLVEKPTTQPKMDNPPAIKTPEKPQSLAVLQGTQKDSMENVVTQTSEQEAEKNLEKAIIKVTSFEPAKSLVTPQTYEDDDNSLGISGPIIVDNMSPFLEGRAARRPPPQAVTTGRGPVSTAAPPAQPPPECRSAPARSPPTTTPRAAAAPAPPAPALAPARSLFWRDAQPGDHRRRRSPPAAARSPPPRRRHSPRPSAARPQPARHLRPPRAPPPPLRHQPQR
ncbi:pollen-specific leucine-rich repeat extensin-like protein 1 [Cryptomeria japonica]|uniref:pollen-specific leucine-rich repeat extensin-like protein 1 n=1 Tax=Cryptomeria japonica TaxID=3369 RepID=UPI0027DA021C|nr:pollen-specific leucine-rich repeat extensin-like protein 1 [Cryptomeria japonica]